jgi:hypothetical protein
VELKRKSIAILVEPVVGRYRTCALRALCQCALRAPGLMSIAAAGRSGVQEVYGVLYLDVGCDVCFGVALTHHFSPLITAIRREH